MKHDYIEKNIGIMTILILIVISFGGLVEIVPLFFQKDVTEPIEGLKPLNPLEIEGRDVYIKEGCHVCHTQMVRPFRTEVERYGHYSVAGEHVYEHPFLWGSKRTGPDLARVGGRYSDDWHRIHLFNPRSVVPDSKMPSYPWLRLKKVDEKITKKKIKALIKLGVPYNNSDIEKIDIYLKNKTEEDALIAYLQQLGIIFKEKNKFF